MACKNCSANGYSNIVTEEINGKKYGQLSPHDWMAKLPVSPDDQGIVEISFKNNRKEIYFNKNKLILNRGDYVAVQCDSGHGVGIVSLTGKLAELQMKKRYKSLFPEKIIYRKASQLDIDKLIKARLREKSVLIKSKQIADSLKLEMKISEVEFQGDGSKATFFYIADERIDFRELIKIYATEFGVRIDMRQIGSRQESALIGGYGSCGRELCCSTWRTKLETVSTTAARIQELPVNAQKLTGQCGKLKCCLMYELDQYIEAHKDFPDVLLELETERGIAFPQKKDLLKKIIWYSIGSKDSMDLVPISLERVKEIIGLNKKGIKAEIEVLDNNGLVFTHLEKTFTNERSKENNIKKKKKSFDRVKNLRNT
jgi:cell fate regulator YaaT (PSP1 superfamily)